jgi:hypothetical protein
MYLKSLADVPFLASFSKANRNYGNYLCPYDCDIISAAAVTLSAKALRGKYRIILTPDHSQYFVV